jgi:hypothetical protein
MQAARDGADVAQFKTKQRRHSLGNKALQFEKPATNFLKRLIKRARPPAHSAIAKYLGGHQIFRKAPAGEAWPGFFVQP